MKKTLLLLICISVQGFSQHFIPFASTGNRIELSISNTSFMKAENVTVEVTQKPVWLQFVNLKTQIPNLEPSAVQKTNFTFSVDKSSPVCKPEQVSFTISNSNGEKWSKTLSLQVSPPDQFELLQNYPNPFNPATTIGYQLPVTSNISLKVYDILGKEVASLDEGIKEAGYHQKEWNAINVSSGFYVYQLSWKNERGEKKFQRKKLMVMK